MAKWSEAELDELGPGLRGFVANSVSRKTEGRRYVCATCSERFGVHPGKRSRFCPACRPQERLRMVREAVRRLRAHRKSM